MSDACDNTDKWAQKIFWIAGELMLRNEESARQKGHMLADIAMGVFGEHDKSVEQRSGYKRLASYLISSGIQLSLNIQSEEAALEYFRAAEAICSEHAGYGETYAVARGWREGMEERLANDQPAVS